MSYPFSSSAKPPDPIELQVRRSISRADPLLSVIIPLAAQEPEPIELLGTLPDDCEIILARGGSRATSMNRAAATASGRHLWFVHADTTLEPGAVEALESQLPRDDAVLYFGLRFDGGLLMRVTEMGVAIRSRLLRTPFGDQALCISKKSFEALGGYDERAIKGEDHLLVLKARRSGLKVHPVRASILTSARKYQENGWLRTTLLHLRLTLRQALQRH